MPPTTVAAATDSTATCIERRAPKRTRLRRSRPRASVSRAIAASTPVGGRPNAAGALREADSGIQVAIQKVHDDVERHEQDRDREHSALNERVVTLHDGREEHAADAGDGEDLLDNDRASEELTDLNAQ